MSYVRWASAKRIHRVSIKKSGGIKFSPAKRKFTARSGQLTTVCGEYVPDDHEGSDTLTADELNNELCVTCRGSNVS